MAKSWPEFYADYDGTKFFWKFLGFDQNNPVLKFDTFFAIISTCLHNNLPKFGVHGSFLTLHKMSEKDFEISKILQNLGIKSESRQCSGDYGSLIMTHYLCSSKKLHHNFRNQIFDSNWPWSSDQWSVFMEKSLIRMNQSLCFCKVQLIQPFEHFALRLFLAFWVPPVHFNQLLNQGSLNRRSGF